MSVKLFVVNINLFCPVVLRLTVFFFYHENVLYFVVLLLLAYNRVVSTSLLSRILFALRYKPEGHRIDSWLSRWNLSLTQSFWPHCGPEVDSVSNRIEYQRYILGFRGGWCVGLTTLPSSCTSCLEILGASTSCNPMSLSRPVMGQLYLDYAL